MRIRWTSLSIFCTLAATMVASASPPLQRTVESLVDSHPIPRSCVTVSVRDARTGEELVDIDDDREMIPASNMKLITSAAAALGLGHDFRFATSLHLLGDDLIIIGGGDPAFADPTLMALDPRIEDLDGLLDLWVDGVVTAERDAIGTIVVDDSIFDRIWREPSWPKDQLNTWYCCEVAGVNVQLNIFLIGAAPRPGTTATITVSPSNAPATLQNRTTSRPGPRSKDAFSVITSITNNNLRATGNVTATHDNDVKVATHEPPRLLGHLLAARLRARGIDVGAVRLASSGEQFSQSRPVGPRFVTPISTVLSRCNEDSYNLYAEALLKRLGAQATHTPGSFENGAAAVQEIVADRLGSRVSGLTVVDGSGMSRLNRLTASLMTSWLTTFTTETATGRVFIESLSVPRETGTLKQRFRGFDLHGATVRAKSGFLNGVSTLSGYLFADERDPLAPRWAFSVLTNDLPGRAQPAKDLQEAIVSALGAQLMEMVSPVR